MNKSVYKANEGVSCMEKKIISILCFLIIVLCLFIAVPYFSTDHSMNNQTTEIPLTTKLDKLESILKNSTYFSNSTFSKNEVKEILNIDSKYDILIKNGVYSMTIKDSSLEKGYCDIVDAIEYDLGHPFGASIDTCEKTLKGMIEIGGISVEIFDNYKVLTVVSDEQAKLYNVDRTHQNKELISTDEINYNIQLDNFLFTSMSAKFKENEKNYSICGHLYNAEYDKKVFKFNIYDNQKQLINTKNYNYINETNKFQNFCIEYSLNTDNVRYYSIEMEE